MPIFSVYIINKAGSLIYDKDFNKNPKLPSNEKIMLASMFHSLYAITSKVSPENKSSGIEVLETDTFRLQCFQTLTGTKFFVIAAPEDKGLDSVLKQINELYADFVLKNPFYSLEMPIRIDLFDQTLSKLINDYVPPP
eukprot:Colp12_sorted_trinity150504_noHs@21160